MGLPPILSNAPALPSLPALGGFAAAPVYDTPVMPRDLIGFELSWNPGIPAPLLGVLRASAGLSAGRGNIRASDFRFLMPFYPWATTSLSVFSTWLAVWGTPPPSGQVTFSVNLIDPLSGFAGPAVTAATSYLAVAFQTPAPGNVIISFNGTVDAVLSDASIEFNFIPEAGG